MTSGPPLKKLKQSMLSFMKPSFKMSEGLPKFFTSDANTRQTSLVGAEEMDQEDVPSNGNCMFSALAKQLEINGINRSEQEVRAKLVTYLEENATEEPVLRIPCPGLVSALDVTSNGFYCAAAVGEKIYIWMISTGKLKATLTRHWSKITCLKFSSCGLYLVSGDEHGRVLVWSLSSVLPHDSRKEPLIEFNQHSQKVNDIWIGLGRFSVKVATASENGSVKLWNLTTGELFNSFVFEGPAKAVIADHAELQLFVGLKDGSIRVVNATKSDITSTTIDLQSNVAASKPVILNGHSSCDLTVTWDGKLLSGLADGTVKLWSTVTRNCMKTTDHKGPLTNCVVALMPTHWNETEKQVEDVVPLKFNAVNDERESVVLHLRRVQLPRDIPMDNDARMCEELTSNFPVSKSETKYRNEELYRTAVDKILD